MRMSTLPSSLTSPNPSGPPSRPPRPVALSPTIFTDRVLPSAGWLWNFCTAADAEDAFLKVTRMIGSGLLLIRVPFTISPHRLKMATTSSGVVPKTRPVTSTTFPWDAALAPLMVSCSEEDVAACRALPTMAWFRLAFGAPGTTFKRADSELCCSNISWDHGESTSPLGMGFGRL